MTSVRQLATLLLIMAAVHGGIVEHVQAEQDWKTISAHVLKQMIDGDEDICLVNVLPKIMFNAGHIEGSVNVPIDELESYPHWPEDKDMALIFYCMGHG
jgi:rhodanese-related sulfurtransferase